MTTEGDRTNAHGLRKALDHAGKSITHYTIAFLCLLATEVMLILIPLMSSADMYKSTSSTIIAVRTPALGAALFAMLWCGVVAAKLGFALFAIMRHTDLIQGLKEHLTEEQRSEAKVEELSSAIETLRTFLIIASMAGGISILYIISGHHWLPTVSWLTELVVFLLILWKHRSVKAIGGDGPISLY